MNKINSTFWAIYNATLTRADIAEIKMRKHYKSYNEATDDAARSASRKDFIDSRQEYLRAHTTLARLAKLS